MMTGRPTLRRPSPMIGRGALERLEARCVLSTTLSALAPIAPPSLLAEARTLLHDGPLTFGQWMRAAREAEHDSTSSLDSTVIDITGTHLDFTAGIRQTSELAAMHGNLLAVSAVQIDWGNGGQSPGWLEAADGNAVRVMGRNQYDVPGRYTITVDLADTSNQHYSASSVVEVHGNGDITWTNSPNVPAAASPVAPSVDAPLASTPTVAPHELAVVVDSGEAVDQAADAPGDPNRMLPWWFEPDPEVESQLAPAITVTGDEPPAIVVALPPVVAVAATPPQALPTVVADPPLAVPEYLVPAKPATVDGTPPPAPTTPPAAPAVAVAALPEQPRAAEPRAGERENVEPAKASTTDFAVVENELEQPTQTRWWSVRTLAGALLIASAPRMMLAVCGRRPQSAGDARSTAEVAAGDPCRHDML